MVRKFLQLIVMTALFSIQSVAHSETLFEGYYKVVSSGEHLGYYIMKHEYDAKKKQFIATTFMKLKNGNVEDTESIKAVADEEKFRPISYSYTSVFGGKTKTIDAKFEKNRINATVSNDGKPERIMKSIQKDTILSSFLIYAILRSPQGLKPKTNFAYTAIAEESGEESPGIANLLDYETADGFKVMRVKNNFLKSESVNLVSEQGQVMVTAMPLQKLTVELVGQPSVATAGFKVPSSILASLFGQVPTGQKNVLSAIRHTGSPVQATSTTGTMSSDKPAGKLGGVKSGDKAAVPPDATKQQGVPAGKGIQLKVNNGAAKPEAAPEAK